MTAAATVVLCAVYSEVLGDNSAVLYGPVLRPLLQACPYTVQLHTFTTVYNLQLYIFTTVCNYIHTFTTVNASVNTTDQASTC